MNTIQTKLTRVCTDCKKSYSLDANNFHRSKSVGFGGFTYRCKECNRSHGKNRKKRYPSQREYMLKYKKQWRENKLNKEKIQAYTLLNNLVRSGKVKRGNCEECGSKTTQGHHSDYSKPLDVRWLCPSHHQQLHQKLFHHPKFIK